MDFRDVVHKRRSVRSYDPSARISDSQLRELFELVKLSPSSYNAQPGEFIVVRSAENKERLWACTRNQQHVREASAVVIVLGATDIRSKAGEVADDRLKKGLMDEAKKERFLATIDQLARDKPRATVWTVRSTSLAAMTLMLAAQNMGLASCPIEGFDAALVRKEFSVPDSYEVVLLVTLGVPLPGSKLPARPMRYGYEHIVHLEEFGHHPESRQ